MPPEYASRPENTSGGIHSAPTVDIPACTQLRQKQLQKRAHHGYGWL
jgi:hypothetical protein